MKPVEEREAAVEMLLRPIGTVKNERKEPSLVPRSGDLEREKAQRRPDWREMESELIIDPSLEECLEGLEEFSHIIVLYWMHRVSEEARSETRKVHPQARKDLPLVGVLSTRSPVRPNPIGKMTVRLLERKGNILKVTGLDAIDGTPIIDIKPYFPDYDSVSGAKVSDWVRKLG